jgi:hypothetical protein
MRPAMMKGIPVLLLALAACHQTLTDPSSSAASPVPGQTLESGTTSSSDQVKALQSIGSAGTTASQLGFAMGNPAIAGAGAAVAALADAASAASTKSIATPTIDPTKRFEYADVYVDLGDPMGMRSLVPYLMNQKEWMILQCEMLTPTFKHYKFQRVTDGQGRALPSTDPFQILNNSNNK